MLFPSIPYISLSINEIISIELISSQLDQSTITLTINPLLLMIFSLESSNAQMNMSSPSDQEMEVDPPAVSTSILQYSSNLFCYCSTICLKPQEKGNLMLHIKFFLVCLFLWTIQNHKV